MPLLEQVLEKYPEKIKIVFKHYPIRSHRNARMASAATIAADKRDKFWEFHDILFENHRKLSADKILEIAKSFGFDEKAFLQDMQSIKTDTRINQDIRDARRQRYANHIRKRQKAQSAVAPGISGGH